MRAPVGTIRIYKIAEVLGIPSQEVVRLLRTQHGIEAKSASSTVEEIVARQFAERVARKRNVALPPGALFSQRAASKRANPPEPAAPAAPRLGPPRLVKSAKTARAAAEAADAGAAAAAAEAARTPPADTAPPPPVPGAHAPVAGAPATAEAPTAVRTASAAPPPRVVRPEPRLRVEGAPRLRVETPRIRVEEPPAQVAEASRGEVEPVRAQVEAAPGAQAEPPRAGVQPPRTEAEPLRAGVQPPRTQVEQPLPVQAGPSDAQVAETPPARTEPSGAQVAEPPPAGIEPHRVQVAETPAARIEPPRVQVAAARPAARVEPPRSQAEGGPARAAGATGHAAAGPVARVEPRTPPAAATPPPAGATSGAAAGPVARVEPRTPPAAATPPPAGATSGAAAGPIARAEPRTPPAVATPPPAGATGRAAAGPIARVEPPPTATTPPPSPAAAGPAGTAPAAPPRAAAPVRPAAPPRAAAPVRPAAPPRAAAPVRPAVPPRAAARPAAPPRAAAPASPAVPTPARRPGSGLVLRPTGRVAPPRLRLRIEEPKPAKPRPAAPAAPRTPVRPVQPGAPAGPAGGAARPPLGGPRPLPSQPVRPPLVRPLPPRPAVGYRPPPRPHHRPGGRRAQYRRTRTQTPATPPPPPPVTRTITLAEGMTVKDLAERLEVKPKDVLKKLIERRVMMTINTTLDSETATTIAREFGADVKMRTFEEEMVVIEAEEAKPDDLIVRAPVVTVMGHVDHGKTTLLDAIREAKVAEGEAGGITQHIGAYSVAVNGRKIVFLDTPGHEAFTLMRARGAQVTDVVVLVVAADDGVMPQTQEAIDHARAASVPIIVAINKIDKADANLDRVRKELAERGLTPEDWGGSTVTVPVSAKKRDNLDGLLEMILLVTELEEQKANPKRAATGTVLEAKVDRGRGPVATILVQDGTLRVGDNFIAGVVVGRVRALLDDRLQKIGEAGPASPVEVLGLTGLPQPGDAFQAVTDAAKARQIAVLRQNQAKEKALGGRGQRLTLESLQQQLSEGEAKELPIIIKADVQGSAEVLADSLGKLGDERVKTRIIHTGVGAISEWDVLLASTSNAIIVGFNVRPDRNASGVAEREGVDVRLHSVIYDVTDELKKALAGLLDPTTKEVRLGAAEIRQLFKIPKFGTAAGCMVTEGVVTRAGDARARLVRDGVVVHEGRIGSLRRFKDDVNEVRSGMECGLAFERFADLKAGDVVESFTVEKVVATV